MQNEMVNTFKKHDANRNNCNVKEDFINVIFGTVKSVSPADLMKFMLGFTNCYEEGALINYDDFLHAIDHYGS